MKEVLLTDMRHCIVTAEMVQGVPEFVVQFRPSLDALEYAATKPTVFKHWALFQDLPQEIQDGIMQLAKGWLIAKRLSGELNSEYRMDY